jgi:hypothetical protein
MPSPNKLPSSSATLPPESICPAPPQIELTWLNTTAACLQPVGSATWQAERREKQLGHTLGPEGLPLLRNQDIENHILGRPGA